MLRSAIYGVRVSGKKPNFAPAAREAASMADRKKRRKRSKPKTALRLPDLEPARNAVLNSLPAASSQESYGHAIDEFIGWYCSEPRLAFNRTVVLRYRFFLEQKNLAPSTINVRLAAARSLAYEAADTGMLSPELARRHPTCQGCQTVGHQGRKLADSRAGPKAAASARRRDCPR